MLIALDVHSLARNHVPHVKLVRAAFPVSTIIFMNEFRRAMYSPPDLLQVRRAALRRQLEAYSYLLEDLHTDRTRPSNDLHIVIAVHVTHALPHMDIAKRRQNSCRLDACRSEGRNSGIWFSQDTISNIKVRLVERKGSN